MIQKNSVMNRNLLVYISASIVLLSSCRKSELPVPAPDMGGIISATVNLSPTYENQFYFDLSSNSNKGQSHRMDWDLRFSCDPDNPHIQMNAAKMMLVSRVDGQTFESVTNTSSFNNNVKAEDPTGRMDSLAVKGGNLFLFNRGTDVNGTQLGVLKMEIIENNGTHFTGRFANLDGSNEQTVTIPKNTAYNYVYMKWHVSSAITTPVVEPLKEEWDLIFTQYTETFYEPHFMPYSVVGCLTNSYNTLSVEVTNKSFDEIDEAYALSLTLSNDRNVIGYNWKTFLFDDNKYEIHSNKIYIIKDNEANYYKLRFVDFYSETGEKGAPTFEFQRL